ncbi:MAG TPA: hypothetical protein VJN88_13875, partial [Ktedonobacterales bacterium]|nr:hypothetical protein [Ktedonobacterales bacterium]
MDLTPQPRQDLTPQPPLPRGEGEPEERHRAQRGEGEPEQNAAAVIVATGSGPEDDDLLWAPVAGRPLLAWTVAAFEDAPNVGEIALVVARERLDDVRLLWL